MKTTINKDSKFTKTGVNKLIYFLVTLFFFSVVNFYFSNLLSSNLAMGWRYSNKLIKIIYVENTGAAFSIMQNATEFLIALSITAICIIIYYMFKYLTVINLKWVLFFSLLSSGILGNLYERLVFGHVRDFFQLTFIKFPIFNISDIFINIGVIGIIIMILLLKKNN